MPADAAVYAGAVLIWGTTWIALRFQLGTVAPEVSLLWRFLIAAPVMFLVCRVTGNRILFPPTAHLRFAAIGVFMFSLNFVLAYNAGRFVVSGLLAIIFSLSAVFNILLNSLVLREPLRRNVVIGAVLGVGGVALLFSHEFTEASLGGGTLTGLALGVVGSLLFSVGGIMAARNGSLGISALSGNAWAMLYGVLANFVIALVAGSAFTIDPRAPYLLALIYLALPGTVLVFWMYLTLIGRIGADRAGYVTVLSPVLALIFSTIFEHYRWSLAAAAGLALVVLGNVLVLRRPPA